MIDIEEAGTQSSSERAELARVLASAAFGKATRASTLLTYIVDHTLEHRLDSLTEQQIGINVFGRTPGYNSADDTIVRGTARLLRQRLDAYYNEEGRHDPVRVTIPKGSYVAHFDDVLAPSEAVAADTMPSLPGPAKSKPPALPLPTKWALFANWPLSAKLACMALIVCALALTAALVRRAKAPSPAARIGPQALWSELFTPGRRTLIVPGDAALDAYIVWEQRPVTLDEYTQQSYQSKALASRPPLGNDVPLAARSMTPMADLRLVAELVQVPEHMGRPDLEPWVEIRYARDVAVADSHDNNLILIGSETFNPWTSLYQNSMDFHSEWDSTTGRYTITNRAPQPGESAAYTYDRNAHGPAQLAYTQLAFLDNSQGSGKVLIVEGTSMGTTYAALTFLTHEQLWRPVLKAATDKDGRLHNFEVLLGSEFVRGGLSNTRRVALHVH
jgi:hypothetical protein